jgi:hypothetical protein
MTDLTPELAQWRDHYVLFAVQHLHDVNRHTSHEQNAPRPGSPRSWLSLEGCNHGDCRNGRELLAALTPEPTDD